MSDSEDISGLITAFGRLCISDRVPSSENDDGEASNNVRTPIPTPGEGDNASTTSNHSIETTESTDDSSLGNPLEDIKRRVKDPSEHILLVGESETLSTTLALAAMRGSFDNIQSSNINLLDLRSGTEGVTHFIGLMRKNIKQCSEVNRMRYGNLIIDLLINKDDPSVNALLWKLSLHIDATKISESIHQLHEPIDTSIIFFNFPWITLDQRAQNGNNARLLQGFVTSAALQQSEGGLLLIGLTTHSQYRYQYAIEDLIAFAETQGYPEHHRESIGEADDTRNLSFLRDCINHGYRHHSENPNAVETHRRFVADGSDLHVFVKGETP